MTTADDWTATDSYRTDDTGRPWRLYVETGTRDYHEQWRLARAHELFTRNPDGSRTCNDCGATYTRADGAVMRSHRRRVHGEHHETPGVCDA